MTNKIFFVISIICIVQKTLGQVCTSQPSTCYGNGIPIQNTNGIQFNQPTNAIGPITSCSANSNTAFGDVSVSGELPVSGMTTISGNVPVVGYVTFDGYVPAGGLVSVLPGCGCGCSK